MNERIKELEKRAFDAVWDLDNDPIGPGTHFKPDGFEKKFVELIVAECCQVLSKETIRHDGYGYNQHALYQKIREHFGVE